jgi:hypothetical protein
MAYQPPVDSDSGLDSRHNFEPPIARRQVWMVQCSEGSEYSFHTQRSPGSTFTFALQGDSHPERYGKMYDPDLYVLTMNNVSRDQPDFYLTLGDDFSIDRVDFNQC